LSAAEKAEIWDALERGEAMRAIARRLGRAQGSIREYMVRCEGRRPRPPGASELRLSLREREEISRFLAGGESLRRIATTVGRAPSTICREVAANGGRRAYRALLADRQARRRTRRPKRAKLALNRRLRRVVERKLELWWSPQQIPAWFASAYPDDAEMRVSHETIYLSLFAQGRGALRQELHTCLRSGRALRRPKAPAKGGFGQGQIVGKVMISERPAEADDRAVVGHWEGDLLMGRRMTAVATLVERHSRYVMLLRLPAANTAESVRTTIAKRIVRGSLGRSTLARESSLSHGPSARLVDNTPSCGSAVLRFGAVSPRFAVAFAWLVQSSPAPQQRPVRNRGGSARPHQMPATQVSSTSIACEEGQARTG
jgi:IS30 family transposase